MVTYSKFTDSKQEYIEKISKEYRVWVNGEEIPVYTCRISALPFNRPWPGYQRAINQTELASFVNIVSDEAVSIEVEVAGKYNKIMIRPYSKGIEWLENNGKISFELGENGQLVFSCDDLHNCLYIFNSKPVKAPDPDSVTYYFGPGFHKPGKIVLKDNESIYVDKDALVMGSVYAENAKNIRVWGNGLMDDSFEARYTEHCYIEHTNGNVKFYDCENVKVEGVLFRDSAIWCINIFHCTDVEIDGIKVFRQWRYNTDGVDIVNSRNVFVRNSFIHSFDDTVTIKGIDRYRTTDNENIITENCVMWCDWGKTCELGFETACRMFRNIVFRNCDIIRGGNTALDVQNGDCAEICDVLYENINIEYNSFDNYPVLQRTEDQTYDAYDEKFVPVLIGIENYPFRNPNVPDTPGGVPGTMPYLDLEGIEVSVVHDIRFKNINVYYDEKIPKVDGKYNVPIISRLTRGEGKFYNLTMSGFFINGEKIDRENALVTLENSEDIRFID